MKIALTGHTGGLGLSMANYFANGHEVIGFSKSTGNMDQLIPTIQQYDIFVNNACAGFMQADLLYAAYERLKDQPSLIVNLSSISSDGIKSWPHQYAVHKAALDKAAEQLANIKGSKCKIINIRPGWIDVPRVASIMEPKIDPIHICEIIDFVLQAWVQGKSVISSITVMPNA